MLIMITERFKGGDWRAVGERFKERGRMIPEGSGVSYVASWMRRDGAGCFQIMEAPTALALEPWMAAWRDLAEFDVVPVQTSAEFWAGM